MLQSKKSYDDNYALFETCIAFPTSNACRDCINYGQAGSLCGKCQSSFKNYCHSDKAPKVDAYSDDYSYVDQVQGNCEDHSIQKSLVLNW